MFPCSRGAHRLLGQSVFLGRASPAPPGVRLPFRRVFPRDCTWSMGPRLLPDGTYLPGLSMSPETRLGQPLLTSSDTWEAPVARQLFT